MAIGCVTSSPFSPWPILLRETHWDWSWHQQEHCGRVLSDWLWVWCISITEQITRTSRDVCVIISLIGWRAGMSFSHWLVNRQILLQRTDSKTVSTWETFSVTCHCVSSIGHRKVKLVIHILTMEMEIHCIARVGFEKSIEWRTPSWWWFDMLQFLTTLKIPPYTLSQYEGLSFGHNYGLFSAESYMWLGNIFLDWSCWFKNNVERAYLKTYLKHTQKTRLVFPKV